VVVVSRSEPISRWYSLRCRVDDIGPARSNSADCGYGQDRTDEMAGRFFLSLYASVMCAFPSILPILPCGLFCGAYASACNLVLLIRVQTKAFSD
jgi:hypothetical protein